jgi:beta-lactamase regulating signal transducer with metallopeptidase domain
MDTFLQIGLSNAASATLLALLAAAAGCCCRPALRHSLWLLVLVKLITPSMLPVHAPWPAAETPAAVADAEVASAEPRLVEAVTESASVLAEPAIDVGPHPEADSSPPEAVPAAAWTFVSNFRKPLVLALWLTGSLLWWLLAAWRIRRFQRALRHACPAPAELTERCRELSRQLGLRRGPGVWLIPGPLLPMLWALGRTPRLLLPRELWERLTDEQRDSLLLHELAHLRRRDHWVRRLELIVLGLYWWHPVAWWARHELQEAEEECCDAWVVWAKPEAAPAYASALVETLTFLSQARTALPLPASGVGQVRPLKRRLTMILRGTPSRTLTWGGLFAVLALAAGLLPWLPTWAEPPKSETQAPVARDDNAGRVYNLVAQVLDKPGPRPATQAQTLAEQIEAAQDEVELLEVQLEAKRAQLKAATMELQDADNHMRVLQRAGGGVPFTTIQKAQSQVTTLRAQILVKEAELKEPEVRLRQAQRRLTKLRQQAVPPANRNKPAGQADKKGQKDGYEAKRKGTVERADLLDRLYMARSDVEMLEERAAWSARMAKRGFITEAEAHADAERLKAAKADIQKLELDLQIRDTISRRKDAPGTSAPARAPQARPSDAKQSENQKRLEKLETQLDKLIKELEALRRELRQPQSKLPVPAQPFVGPNPGQLYHFVPSPTLPPGSPIPNPEYKVVPYDPSRPNPKNTDPRSTPTIPLMPAPEKAR